MSRRPRGIPIDKEMARELRKQRKAFIKKFGREPGPNDLINFDPDAPGPVPQQLNESAVRADVIAAMRRAGIAPQLIYAYSRTGMLVMDGMSIGIQL